MTNNDLTNMGETWYEFKYFSYRDGAMCLYKMPQDEFERFEKHYEEIKDICEHNGIHSLEGYIKAVLSLNN